MSLESDLRSFPPGGLGSARAEAHRAAQLLTKAARANLDPVDDDSHSNLRWMPRDRTFRSQSLENAGGTGWRVALSMEPLTLAVECGQETVSRLRLAGRSIREVESWLDAALMSAQLRPASGIELPYELPLEIAGLQEFGSAGSVDGFPALASWFDLTHAVLTRFVGSVAPSVASSERPGEAVPGRLELSPSPIRCWPHHFDLATFVSVRPAPERGAGVGVGLSPGDESYAQPYVYVNAWPHLKGAGLPELPAPGHWHTEGFTGAVATGEDVLRLTAIEEAVAGFVQHAFRASLELMER